MGWCESRDYSSPEALIPMLKLSILKLIMKNKNLSIKTNVLSKTVYIIFIAFVDCMDTAKTKSGGHL